MPVCETLGETGIASPLPPEEPLVPAGPATGRVESADAVALGAGLGSVSCGTAEVGLALANGKSGGGVGAKMSTRVAVRVVTAGETAGMGAVDALAGFGRKRKIISGCSRVHAAKMSKLAQTKLS